jgi:predicted acylesterase/phospholipase RssA
MIIRIKQPDPRFAEIIKRHIESGKKEKIGLCLFGGGLNGPFQYGVELYLKDIKLLDIVDVVAGTSIGAINGAETCKDIEQGLKVWGTIKVKDDVYKRDTSWYNILWQLTTGSDSILDPSPLYNKLKKEFDGNEILHKELITTSAKIDEDTEVDGGLINNSPFDILIDEGCKKIISIACFPVLKNNILQIYRGDKDIFNRIIKSSTLPVLFPAKNKNGKKVKIIDVIKKLLPTLLNATEDRNYEIFDLKLKIAKLEGNPIEHLEICPNVGEITHELLDCGHVMEDMQKGYDKAVKEITPETIEEFLK